LETAKENICNSLEKAWKSLEFPWKSLDFPWKCLENFGAIQPVMPALCGASTPFRRRATSKLGFKLRRVDDRGKPGHDGA
jgi:hypothetical protein